jgi:hypothetical protein
MTIRAKLYYNHFDANGDVDGDKQIASITLSESQINEKGFFMEIFITDKEGRSCSSTIIFHPNSVGIQTNGLIKSLDEFIAILPTEQDESEDDEELDN